MPTFIDAPSADSHLPAAADFAIFTAGMTIDETAGLERPIVRMVGSSTEQDLHKDTMTISALQDMVAAPPGLLIWLNHDYTVPDSLFGSLAEQPILISKGGFTDLHLAVEVELENPAAQKTFRFIQKKRRLGCSVGCSVEDYKLVDAPGSDSPLIHITQVRPVEWSVVGIPANQRSWVENAARGLFQKALYAPKPPDDIERLAMIVKSLFPTEFNRMLDGTPYETLKSVKARPMTSKRILWEPESKKFFLANGTERTGWYEIPRADGVLESVRKSVFGGNNSDLAVTGTTATMTPPTITVAPGAATSGTIWLDPSTTSTVPFSTTTASGAWQWFPTTGQWQWFPGVNASPPSVPSLGTVTWGVTSGAPVEAPDLIETTVQGYLAGRDYAALSDAEKDALANYVALILADTAGEN